MEYLKEKRKLRVFEMSKIQKITAKKSQRAITLIALVITIIVLLILAGVSIAMLTEENGILAKTIKAKIETEEANVRELAQMDILEYQMGNGKITGKQLKTVLDKYFNGVPEEKDLGEKLKDSNYSLKAKDAYGGEEIEVKLSELYSGDLYTASEPPDDYGTEANDPEGYVGCYADLNGDKVPDGIIYADLAVDGEGQWNENTDSNYSYSKKKGLKSYVVGDEVTSSEFGGKQAKILKAKAGSQGENRFYIMALEDLDDRKHYWYYNAYEKLKNPENSSEKISFEESNGKTNTETMMKIYEDEEYGGPYEGEDHTDMWEIPELQTKVDNGWFVPSRAEWAAFGVMLYTNFSVDKNNYDSLGLRDYYWSSSQKNVHGAWYARFDGGYMSNEHVNYYGRYVRLSTTF